MKNTESFIPASNNMTHTPSKKGYYGRHYDGILDAEQILEQIMHRHNWSINVRDAIAYKLMSIVDNAKCANRYD